jgi:hypothetical protein
MMGLKSGLEVAVSAMWTAAMLRRGFLAAVFVK